MESNTQSNGWLDLSAIEDITSFDWVAKILSKGLEYGNHNSYQLSQGMEFSQYRPYTQGDDYRLIDWKIYGRTEKLYIRQANIESNHVLNIALDCSHSMKYEEQNLSKLKLAKIIIASLTNILLKQGDHCRVYASDGLTVARNKTDWTSFLKRLIEIEPSDQYILPPSATNAVYLWITDLYHSMDEIKTFMDRLKHPKTELVLFHLVGDLEINLDFPNHVTYIDLESKKEIQTSTKEIKINYTKDLKAHFGEVKNLCYQRGVYLHTVSMIDAIPRVLKNFFHQYQYLSIS